MTIYKDLPLRKKLLRIIVMASTTALLATAISLFIYDANTYRPRLISDLNTISDLYVLTLPATLTFNDQKAAHENLMSLKAQKAIQLACVYDSNFKLFSHYTRNQLVKTNCPKRPQTIGKYFFTPEFLEQVKPIIHKGNNIGYLYLRYVTPTLFNRLLQYSLIASAVFFSLLVVAFLLGIQLEKNLTAPLLRLSHTAKVIRENKNYHLRAEKFGNDEVGSLTDAFNQMLDTIEQSLMALSKSESSFRQLSESNIVGTVFSNVDGSISNANDYYLNILGATREELEQGKLFWNIITPPEFHYLDEIAMKEVQQTGTFNIYEKEYFRKDGSRIPIMLSGALLENSQTEMVAYVLEISERKKSEFERNILLANEQKARIEAEVALQMREDFMSIAAHEIRTPLTPLKLQLNLIKSILKKQVSEHTSFAKLYKIIGDSDQHINRLAKLIEDMLDVSHIRAGKLNLHLEEVDVSQIITEIVGRYQIELDKLSIQVTLNIEENLIGLFDRLRIEQVIINLLTNAMKYGAGKPIAIDAIKSEQMVIIKIQDQGIGINEDDQQRVFNRFERAVSVQHFGGFGLGLYITRQIVESHHGTIKVVSQLAQGSTFIVKLPLNNSSQGAS